MIAVTTLNLALVAFAVTLLLSCIAPMLPTTQVQAVDATVAMAQTAPVTHGLLVAVVAAISLVLMRSL